MFSNILNRLCLPQFSVFLLFHPFGIGKQHAKYIQSTITVKFNCEKYLKYMHLKSVVYVCKAKHFPWF